MLEKVFKDHDKWLATVRKMGASKHDAEDIVGDMYVKIGTMLNKGLDISYNGEVNYFYIYKALRTIFLDHVKKKSKTVILDDTLELESGEQIDFDYFNNIVQDELDKMHWYNKKVFEMVQEGQNISALSRQTGIDYHSLYHTYVKVKDKLKKSILE